MWVIFAEPSWRRLWTFTACLHSTVSPLPLLCWFPGWFGTNTLTQKWQNLCLLGNKNRLPQRRPGGSRQERTWTLRLLPSYIKITLTCLRAQPVGRLGWVSSPVSTSQHSLPDLSPPVPGRQHSPGTMGNRPPPLTCSREHSLLLSSLRCKGPWWSKME